MFGRMSYLRGEPARIDELVDFVHWTVKPATDLLAGNLGLGMWVDRASGEALVTTVWTDAEAMSASELAATGLREEAAAVLQGDAMVERAQTLFVDADDAAQVGDVMQLLRIQGDTDGLQREAERLHAQFLPVLQQIPGYKSFVVAANARTRRLVTMTTFRQRVSCDVAVAATEPVRTAAVNRGARIDSITRYEVAIVGIRAPIPLPGQRHVRLPAEAPV